jgi:serine protease Do
MAMAPLVTALFAGFGEAKPEFSLEREVGKLISSRGRAYRHYRTVRDGSRTIEYKAPKEWSEVSGESRIVYPKTDEQFGTGAVVSPDLDKFRSSFAAIGLRLSAATRPTGSSVNDVLDTNSAYYDEACTGPGVKAYNDGRFRGNYEFFTNCGGTKGAAVAVAAISPDEGLFIVVAAQVRTRADLAAVDRAIRSVKVT